MEKKKHSQFYVVLDKTKKIENGVDNENICAKTNAVMNFSTQNPCEKTSTREKLFGGCFDNTTEKDKVVLYAADNVQRCF